MSQTTEATETKVVILEKVKLSLRISDDDFDDEISDLIDAAVIELDIGGIKNVNQEDKLILNAIKMYCKGYFGLSNPDSEKFIESFHSMKTQLSLSGKYRKYLGDNNDV